MDWFLYDNGLRHERVKGAPSCPGEFLPTASSLQMKNALYFNLKSYFVLRAFLKLRAAIFGTTKHGSS